jgi:hypothetical protein
MFFYCYQSLNFAEYGMRVVEKGGAMEFRVVWMQAVKSAGSCHPHFITQSTVNQIVLRLSSNGSGP